jgi:hypothetical protein
MVGTQQRRTHAAAGLLLAKADAASFAQQSGWVRLSLGAAGVKKILRRVFGSYIFPAQVFSRARRAAGGPCLAMGQKGCLDYVIRRVSR